MATRTISTKLAIDGEAEYRASVSKISSELKTLGSELKLVESQFKGESNSMAALTAKGTALQNVYDKQAAKVKECADALKNAQSAQQTYNTRITEANSKIAANDAAMDKLKASTGNTTAAQTKLAAETEKLKKELSDATAGEAAAARGVNDWQRQVNNAQIELNSLNTEIKQNDKYLDEAKASTDRCATSIDKYGKEVKQTAAETENATEKTGLLSKIFAGGFLANIATQALTAVISKIKEFASAAFNTADELMKLESVTGFTTTELQKMTYVGDDLGVSLDTQSGALKKLINNMSSAQAGSGTAYEAFKKLKVEYEDGNGALLDSNEVYGKVIDALGRMTNETERDAAAQDIFGKSATELNPLIEAGSTALGELADKAEAAGAVMSEDAVSALDTTGDAIDHIKQKAESFVGEGLAKIIDGGKTAAETMSDLTSELEKQNNIDSLIDKYRQLTAEVSDSSTNSAQLSIKTAELEQVKQDLIKASGGVVTAFDIENGTFDQQVKVLADATQAEKDYIKNKLITQILENSGEAATKKSAKATKDYTTAEAQLALAIKEKEKVRAKVDAGMASDEALQRATEDVENWQKAMLKAQTAATDVSESNSVAENSLKLLVDNGFMTAAEAATFFANSGIDVSAVLADTGEAAVSAIPEIQSMAEQIDALNASYQTAYDTALASLDGQVGMWTNMSDQAEISVADMQATLDSQVQWFTDYKTNLETIMSVQIPGVDMQPLLDSLSDGTPEAAARAQALADAISKGDTDAVAALAKSAATAQSSKEALADTMAKAATDYDAKMQKIVESTADAVKGMDKSEEAKQAGINTLQSYIDAVNKKTGPLNIAMSNAAQGAMDAWKKKLGIASPSKVFKEYGKNTIEGAIIGVEGMQAALVATYTKMGENLLTGLSKGMKDSSGKVMKTADDIAKELVSRLGDMTSLASTSSDVSELKYKLWSLTTGKGATSSQSSKAEVASLKEQAELEKAQIEATQTALSKMTGLYGENSDESLKLQKQLLQEQIAYEKLKQSIEDVSKAKTVDTSKLSDTADQEYKLWYLDTPEATDVEKLQKQSEVLALKLKIEGETVTDAEKAYADMVAQYGKNSDESIKLQGTLLKEKIAYAELTKQIKELNEAKSKYDSSSAEVSGDSLQSAQIWDSVNINKVKANQASSVMTAQDISKTMESLVNAISIAAGQKASGDLVVEVPINGKALYRATIEDFRAVDAATPKVVSDKI